MALAASFVKGIRYRNPDWPGLRLEALTLEAFRLRGAEAYFRRPIRPDFHHLFLCTAGGGHQAVDFRRLPLRAGTLVHVAPGQVHAFGWDARTMGILLMFAPEALPPGLEAALPGHLQLEPRDRARIAGAFEDLRAEYAATDGGPASARALEHLLAALVLRLDRLAAPLEEADGAGRRELFRLFQQELERRFLRTRAVADYAKRLGYAERTLARATLAVAGVSPKACIDARVLLEAKRLLVHTELPVARIAAHLGFSEATNFTKFFRRGAGLAPEGFRRQEGMPAE